MTSLKDIRRENWMQMEIALPCGTAQLSGNLHLPKDTKSIVLFVHGSGSSRLSPRNYFVAERLNEEGIGTFLFDLLTMEEERTDRRDRSLRFNIDFLAERTVYATQQLMELNHIKDLKIGYFGASTGAAAALQASVALGEAISCVVSRGGRPDLAMESLPKVTAPTLLIVGGEDKEVIRLNKLAFNQLQCEKQIHIVPGASHLFEEPGALEEAAEEAAKWFSAQLV